MIALNKKTCIVCNQRERQTGSYCKPCRAAYHRRYRQRRQQQTEQQTGSATPPTEGRTARQQARIEAEERTLRAAGYFPDRITAKRADQVLSQATGQGTNAARR
ncbi:MAG TPA: hypothetical protein ENN79_10390 [Desulfobacteraceae bacterium]|nr:hypothetical protein [Desulfobacteraceae bacterium]